MGLTPQRAAKDASVFSRSGVVPHGDQESDGAVRTDAHRFEQLWGVPFDEPGQALVQLIDLSGELFDALGEHAQRQVGGLGHRVLVSPSSDSSGRRAGAVGTASTMVSPAPGVSSARKAPPVASVKPRATARPSPTPLPRGESP
nr:hypothetical protein [Streptomyces puniciscabiei]